MFLDSESVEFGSVEQKLISQYRDSADVDAFGSRLDPDYPIMITGRYKYSLTFREIARRWHRLIREA